MTAALIPAALALAPAPPALAAQPPATAARVITDIAYAPADPPTSRGHLLDLYLPRGGGKPRPLVMWSSGSGWLGDQGKEGAAPVAEFFTARGYAVAGISVRASTQARFPAQVHDVKAAVRWLRAHARRYNLDPGRFAIMGNSSGGWVATMAAVTGDVRALEGNLGVTGVSSRVQAAVDFYGPTDFLRMDTHMIDCPFFNRTFGLTDCHNDPRSPESLLVGCPIQTCPAAVARANPVTYVSRADPPLLVLHGQADLLVPHHQSELLYAAVRRACGTAAFYSIPGVGHEHPYVTDPTLAAGFTVSATVGCRQGPTRDRPPPTWQTIERFLRLAFARR
jgi:acetyl esterase/lipase